MSCPERNTTMVVPVSAPYWNRPGEQVYDLLQRLADLADLA